MNKLKVCVDMSATILHHGHINILEKASKLGDVYVALTKDKEVLKKKGYIPELNFKQRLRILKSIKFVKEVVPSNWDIDDEFVKKHKFDILIHGNDEVNSTTSIKKIIFKRTAGISSNLMRHKIYCNYRKIYEKK